MFRKTKILAFKIALLCSFLPVALQAYEFGPDPFRTGAPGDAGTCLASGCHSGALNPSAGSVKIVLPGGNTYVPGVKQRLMVQIVDSTKQKFGFELQARAGATASAGQAGDLSSSDSLTQVICADGVSKPCKANFATQFIEHTQAGYTASTAGSYTYQFDWTPPATNVGNVTLYVASVAGPGGAPNQNNANVYTANLTLTPAASPTGPVIANVQDAESGRTSVVPGSWSAIYGQNLSNLPGPGRAWGAADFTNGNNLPTVLSGVSVTFNGLPAAVYYVSGSQIDAQVPAGISGTVPVVVTNNGTVSAAFTATVVANAPSLFYYPAGTKVYAAATHVDGSLIGDAAAQPGTTKAKAGETVVLYVNGLAPSPSGTVLGAIAYTAGPVMVTLGTTTVTADYSGVAFAGGFQVNVKVPAGLAAGDYAISVSTQGQVSGTGITLPVGP